MKPRVTQKQVALKAGVSHVAVSLALRGHHSISQATQERIQRIAREMGYVPDPMLAGLSAYRLSRRPPAYHSNIGWLNCWNDPQELYAIRDFNEYYVAACERARELGYGVEEIRLADFRGNLPRLEKVLRSRGITGIFLPPAQHSDFELHMDYSRFSVVRFGYSFRHPILHTVANAQSRTVLSTMQNLIKLGYRRIGLFLSVDQDQRSGLNFIGGLASGQQLLAEADRVPAFHYVRGDTKSLKAWIRRSKVDAVMGLAAWEEVRGTGVKVAYSDLSIQYDDGFVTGMYQNCRKIGITAVDFLTGLMLRGETGIPSSPTHLLVESVWSPGRTAEDISQSVPSSRELLK